MSDGARGEDRVDRHTQQDDMPRIIDALVSPHDLKALDNEELAILCHEIREQIIATTSHTGGHVASSLGAVETIVALHAELDCPRDRIVFDVGHQAYAHKLLTGRLGQFEGLRQHGGISGFPNPSESAYDVHPSGHASDSLSIALGLAKARELRGTDEHIVAVIGDASISGGMAFEALNQIGQEGLPLVIVLNDNGMSIAPNVGALARHFSSLRASNAYRDRRNFIRRQMSSSGPAAQATLAFLSSTTGSIKHMLLPDYAMIFEQLGITCLAPIDGHDIGALRRTLHRALVSHGPTLVHVITRKGAGYEPAERTPELFHGIGPYDAKTGIPLGGAPTAPTFTDVFGASLLCEARSDERIVAITAGMEEGTGLKSFDEEFPRRFMDVGISEEHAVGLASGLAAGGAKPVVAVYSTFLQRAIDQMTIDVALANQDVVLCIDRAGLVGADGVTHQGAFDLAFSRMVPNLRVLAPSDGLELESALHTALALGGPFALRYPKGACGLHLPGVEAEVFEPGVSRTLREGDDVAILAFGSMVTPSLAAAEQLAELGIEARVVDMRWIKPLDVAAIRRAAQTKLVVSVEEGVCMGGIGEEVLSVLARERLDVDTLVLGLPDQFVAQGTRGELLHELHLDADGIASAIQARLASSLS